MTMDQLIHLIRASFPVERVPVRDFWRDGTRPGGDIPGEFEKRIAMRPWTDVTMHDWTMTGARPNVARHYLDPSAFRYYLPSLLIGGLQETGYIDWALEAILPTGWRRRTTGKWWQDFAAGFSAEQRAAVGAWLNGIRTQRWDLIGPADQQLVLEAETIWRA